METCTSTMSLSMGSAREAAKSTTSIAVLSDITQLNLYPVKEFLAGCGLQLS